MMRPLRAVALACFVALAACGGGGGSTTPVAKATPTPAPTGTPLPVASVTSALQGAQTYFATLPHQNLNADLAALASQMVASGAFSTAVVSDGGITATLPDGSTALVFADHPESLGYASGTQASARVAPSVAPSVASRVRPAIGGRAATHQIAFLYNDLDRLTFDPTIQNALGNAFTAGLNASSDYGVSVLPITLDNVAALTGIDLLAFATHGMVTGNQTPPTSSPSSARRFSAAVSPTYVMDSTTCITEATKAEYAADDAAGRIFYSKSLSDSGSCAGTWAFTAAFVAYHAQFNPGAIVDNESCWGQSPRISAAVTSTLGAAGVGRYLGWTKSVASVDADQTDTFLYDRLIGEATSGSTGLKRYATQQTPPQRPFPLDDVETALASELRSGPLGTGAGGGSQTYAQSNTPYAQSQLVVTDLGGETVANPPVEYAFPSISTMAMTSETTAGGTLAIYGRFPLTAGTVTITDLSGTYTLEPISWTNSRVTVSLPASGNGSSGLVQVVGADGLTSNQVPLTQWSGSLSYVENDTFTILGGYQGHGTASYTTAFNITFRSDVHPTVPSIDASPVPQNLYFPQVQGNSTATVTALSGHFTGSTPPPPAASATFTLNATDAMSPGPLPPAQDTFFFGAQSGQPSPCNNGTAGPEGDAGNVFCPAVQFNPNDVASCTGTPPASNPEGVCGENVHAPFDTFSPFGGFGVSTGAAETIDPAIVSFTMDPATYAVTVSSPQTSFVRLFGGIAEWNANALVSGTIGAPLTPPNETTPALRSRATPAARR